MSTDIFYLVPGDHEWPIFDGGDKCEYCGIRYHQLFTWPHLNSKHFCSDCNETIRVELVFNLEGSRGHYLAADYITSCEDLLESTNPTLPYKSAVDVVECMRIANLYHAHNKLTNPCPNDETCECENVHDAADTVDGIMTNLGYYTFWNDGVYVYKEHTPDSTSQ